MSESIKPPIFTDLELQIALANELPDLIELGANNNFFWKQREHPILATAVTSRDWNWIVFEVWRLRHNLKVAEKVCFSTPLFSPDSPWQQLAIAYFEQIKTDEKIIAAAAQARDISIQRTFREARCFLINERHLIAAYSIESACEWFEKECYGPSGEGEKAISAKELPMNSPWQQQAEDEISIEVTTIGALMPPDHAQLPELLNPPE